MARQGPLLSRVAIAASGWGRGLPQLQVGRDLRRNTILQFRNLPLVGSLLVQTYACDTDGETICQL